MWAHESNRWAERYLTSRAPLVRGLTIELEGPAGLESKGVAYTLGFALTGVPSPRPSPTEGAENSNFSSHIWTKVKCTSTMVPLVLWLPTLEISTMITGGVSKEFLLVYQRRAEHLGNACRSDC